MFDPLKMIPTSSHEFSHERIEKVDDMIHDLSWFMDVIDYSHDLYD